MIKKHWTPRYIVNRIKESRYRRNNPDAPWLTPLANKILDELIKPDDIGAEFGSGRSTTWLAQHCHHLLSVEDNEEWYGIVQDKIKKLNINNVSYHFAPLSNGPSEQYVTLLENIADNSLDFVLVDGQCRDVLALIATTKVKKGGLLIVDNLNWYIVHPTHSPASATMESMRSHENWSRFYDIMQSWRWIWTSNGVTDTAIFIKK